MNSVGRVTNSEPFCASNAEVEGFDRRPDAEPKLANMPNGRRQSSESGESRLADAVVDDVAFRALGDLGDANGEILLAVEDDVLGPAFLGDFGFLF